MKTRLSLALLLILVSLIPASAAVVCTPLGTLTATLQLCKPAAGETSWDAAINNNATTIDGLFTGASLLKPLNGGLGLNTSTSTGVPSVNAGAWSVNAVTQNGTFVGGATGAITSTAAMTNGQLLIGSTGVAPVLATLTGTTNQVSVANAAGSVTLSTPQNIHTAATPTFSSLALTGLTANSFLFSGTAGLLTTTTAPTNGQLLIGSTGAAPVLAALTAGAGVTITNAAGSITIADNTTPGGAQSVFSLNNSAAYAAVTNTLTETAWNVGTEGKIPAGAINAAGHRFEMVFRGIYGSTNTDTITLRVKLCTQAWAAGACGGTTTVLAITGAIFPAAAVTNQGWQTKVDCNVFTSGVSGTVDCQGFTFLSLTGLTALQADDMVNTSTVTVNTTVDQYISTTAQWSAASASDTITLRNAGHKVY